MYVIQHTANEPPLQDKNWAIKQVAGEKGNIFLQPKGRHRATKHRALQMNVVSSHP
jgi:hypothetical protein